MSQTTTTMPRPVDYGVRPARSISSYLNARILTFVLVIGAIIGVPLYIYLDHELSKGIKAGADGYLNVDLKAMSTFPFDQISGTVEDVPERFRALDGKKVALIGEMYSTEAVGPRVDKFDLVYSISQCCTSGAPLIQHFIKAKSPEQPVPFYNGAVRVKGTLRVDVTRDDGKITGVYHLVVDSVEPV